ncbi:MAG: hypothetical protein NC097_00100 [Clostridium sp.]|nr:hypothetical protein [Prevotella sp.]MCM1428183.1 hypothetical protein [Clostridium sp.]MCM1475914.1 hypothetical protein [Muribaculaceae bacterium]
MKYLLRYITLFILSFIALSANAQPVKKSELFIKIDCPTKAYIGQVVPYTVYLYSVNPNVGNASARYIPDFDGFTAYNGSPSYRGESVTLKGKAFTRWNIGKYYIVPERSGDFKISGVDYHVSIGHPVETYSFFWGPMRDMAYDNYTIGSPDVKIDVKKPGKAPKDFSGAVGSFNISCSLPPGKITMNSPALAVLTVSGQGNLSDIEFPDLDKYFPSAEVKSQHVDRQIVERDGMIQSTAVVEITFLPTSKSGEISPIPFIFFDVKSGKYRTVKSKPVVWKTSGSSHSDHPAPTLNI